MRGELIPGRLPGVDRPVMMAEPNLPAHAMKTYSVLVPKRNRRRATCAEVDCQPHAKGWRTTLSKLAQPELIKELRESGRRFSAELDEGDVITFVFAPGERCFRASTHWIHTGDADIHAVRDGDWRGNPRRTDTVVMRPGDWIDDFANHQRELADEQQKG